jgi:hypothetical protein
MQALANTINNFIWVANHKTLVLRGVLYVEAGLACLEAVYMSRAGPVNRAETLSSQIWRKGCLLVKGLLI